MQASRPPGTSAWSGALVDFVWHLRHPAGAGAQAQDTQGAQGTGLRCVGSWLVYTDASDHLPLVADYEYTPPRGAAG